MMVFRGSLVALVLGVLGAFSELFGALAGLWLGAVARRSLLPVIDLLLQCRLGGIVSGASGEFALISRRLHNRTPDRFGLEECPEVGGFDILGDRFGLRALPERLRKREKERDHGDQQRDLPVFAGRMLGVFGLFHAFMRAHGVPSLWKRDDGRTVW